MKKAFDILSRMAKRIECLQKRRALRSLFEPYLVDTDDGAVFELQKDAPPEIKKAYEDYLKLIHLGTDEDRKMLETWFQAIKPYAIFRADVLAGIRKSAPNEVKEAYAKLKRSGIIVDKNGAVVKF